jgi:hypothetical protein
MADVNIIAAPRMAPQRDKLAPKIRVRFINPSLILVKAPSRHTLRDLTPLIREFINSAAIKN